MQLIKQTWRSMATVLLGMLLVLEVATLVRESDEVREGHASEADMEERLDGAGLDVLVVVVIETFLHIRLHGLRRKRRFEIGGKLLHLLPLDLAVYSPHRHF